MPEQLPPLRLARQAMGTRFECALFGDTCTPLSPVGPCMVSSEGTCAAWYKYGRNG